MNNLSPFTIDLVYFTLAVLGDIFVFLAGGLIVIALVDALIHALSILRG